MAGFEAVLGLPSPIGPTNYEELRGPMPDDGVARRRGRTTGLTQLKRCPTARIDADQRTPETS